MLLNRFLKKISKKSESPREYLRPFMSAPYIFIVAEFPGNSLTNG